MAYPLNSPEIQEVHGNIRAAMTPSLFVVLIAFLPCLYGIAYGDTNIVGSGNLNSAGIGFVDPDIAKGTSGDAYDREFPNVGVNYFSGANTNSFAPNSNPVEIDVDPITTIPDLLLSFVPPIIGAAGTIQFTPTTLGLQAKQLIQLTGRAKGIGSIQISDTTGVNDKLTSLQTLSFPPLSYTVAFHLVTDSGGTSTGLNDATIVQAMLNQQTDTSGHSVSVNSIWGQVNISFTAASNVADTVTANVPTGPFDVGSIVLGEVPQTPATIYLNSAGHNYNATCNIFFVNSISPPPTDPGAGISYNVSSCAGIPPVPVIPNVALATYSIIPTFSGGTSVPLATLAHTVAHELGHCLRLSSSSEYPLAGSSLNVDTENQIFFYQLMYEHSNVTFGTTITPFQRDCISTVVTQ